MTIEVPTDQQVARMREVFDLVKPVGNWKNRILTLVPKESATEAEISEAVVFFCGGFPIVEDAEDFWAVSGAGYYEWVDA